ncbi:MAG: hypothetical protein U0359_29560 [Byssovorax sp.]
MSSTVENASPIEAPPPPTPAPPPVEEKVAVEIDFSPRPSAARRFVVDPFWAGMLGAGASFFAGGLYGLLSEARVIGRPNEGVFLFVCVGSGLVAALGWGYRAPVKSYAALFGRTVGSLFFGALVAALVGVVLAMIFDANHVSVTAGMSVIALTGLGLAVLALRRIRGVIEPGPRRGRLLALAGALLFCVLWAASPALRCMLWSGRSCREAARTADTDREVASLGERGCAGDDAQSCLIAGRAYQRGDEMPRNLGKAQKLYRIGCALGEDEGCARAHGIELTMACEQHSAVGCRDLGNAYLRGDEVDQDRGAAARAFRKACLLGADDACAQAR